MHKIGHAGRRVNVVVTVSFSVSVTVWVIVSWAFISVLVNVSVLVTVLVTVEAGCVIVICDIDGVQCDALDVGHCSSVLGFVGAAVKVVVKVFVDQAPDAVALSVVVRVVGVHELPCNFIVNVVVIVVIDSVVMLVLVVLWLVSIHELPCDVVVEVEQLK